MKAGELYWALVEPHWERVVTDGSADEFLASFYETPPVARDLLAAHWCVAEVCNGGFNQFFFNGTGVLAPEAAAAFHAIGLPRLAALVRTAMLSFGPGYPRDRDACQSRLETLERQAADEADPFEHLDNQFYDLIGSEGGGWEAAADSYCVQA